MVDTTNLPQTLDLLNHNTEEDVEETPLAQRQKDSAGSLREEGKETLLSEGRRESLREDVKAEMSTDTCKDCNRPACRPDEPVTKKGEEFINKRVFGK